MAGRFRARPTSSCAIPNRRRRSTIPPLAESDPATGGRERPCRRSTPSSATSLTWERTDTPENVNQISLSHGVYADVSEHDIGKFQAQLSKVTATGGQFSLTHTVAYDKDRFQFRRQSQCAVRLSVRLEREPRGRMRQPLLQGAGVQFNRIAGPGATPGVYNGVMLARINTDIALADFEASVRNLVSDVETAYWELYFDYRSLDAVIAGRDSALSTWRKIYTLYRIGGKGGEAEKEAQAREQYFLFRSTAEQVAQRRSTSPKPKLRYLMGLAATDGRLIRPKDEPTTAKVVFDWCDVLNEGLVRSVELREQKWIVKRRELELIAAKNFLLPRLDFVAQYRWLGLGNDSMVPDAERHRQRLHRSPDSNAYRTLTSGQFQEWQIGFQLNMPLGFRREMAGVRNAQLPLTKERVKLQEGELELSHQLAFAIRDLETNYVLSQTNFNRRIAAQREVEAVTAAYETDTVTDRPRSWRPSRAWPRPKATTTARWSTTTSRSPRSTSARARCWSTMASTWPRGRGRARRTSTPAAAPGPAPRATYLDYGFTQPRVISRGPIEQHAGAGAVSAGCADRPLRPAPAPSSGAAGDWCRRPSRNRRPPHVAGQPVAHRAAGRAAGVGSGRRPRRPARRGGPPAMAAAMPGRRASDGRRLDDRRQGQLP